MPVRATKKRKVEGSLYEWTAEDSIRSNGDTYYNRIVYDGKIEYHVGDCIAMSILEKVVYGMIMALWQEKTSHKMAEVRYFAKKKDLPNSLLEDVRFQQYERTVEEDSDHLLYETDQTDELQVTHFLHKIQVLGLNESVDDGNTMQAFRCTHFYSIYTKILQPLTALPRHKRSILLYSSRSSLIQSRKKSDIHPAEAATGTEAEIELLEKASQQLQLSSLPKSLPCRENERDHVYHSLRRSIINGGGSPLYITGVQGIGKTATVSQVLRELQAERNRNEIPYFDIFEINGMKLPTPEMTYNVLWQSIQKYDKEVGSLSSKRALDQLAAYFNAKANHRQTIVLLIDEIDCIVKRKDVILYNLLEWSTLPQSKFIIIGIANTMDLPERLETRTGSRFGVDRVAFKPYTSDQIEMIIKDRLESTELVDPVALRVQSKKIAQFSGDIRKALKLCKTAVEKRIHKVRDCKEQSRHVTMDDFQEALVSLSVSPQFMYLQTCRVYECYFIAAAALESKRSEKDEIDFYRLVTRAQQMYRNHGHLDTFTEQEMVQICEQLEKSRVIFCHRQPTTRYPKIRLNVLYNQVASAFEHHPIGQKLIVPPI